MNIRPFRNIKRRPTKEIRVGNVLIGNNNPIQLMDYIDVLEKILGKKAKINYLPLQPGDVKDTYSNTNNLMKDFNYKPSTAVIDGVTNFVNWYKNYYKI